MQKNTSWSDLLWKDLFVSNITPQSCKNNVSEDFKDSCTFDEIINILKKEYLRSSELSKYSQFEEGYAHAMKICIQLIESANINHKEGGK